MKTTLSFPLYTFVSVFLVATPLHFSCAQVSTNFGALPSETTPHTHTSHTAPSSGKHAPHTPAPPPQPSTPPGYTEKLDVPPSAPPQAVIAPPFVPVPTHPPVLPEPVKPVAEANSHTSPYADQGLRVEFAPTRSDMNDTTIAALEKFGARVAEHPEQRLVLHSYATLPGDDLSMPRRLALTRALAVRSVLIHSGVATTRIYPLAHGRPEVQKIKNLKNPKIHEPEDRLDIAVEANPEDGPAPTPVAAPDTSFSTSQGAPAP